jgi:RimJ/RimL family protein N-acetyltransferase
VALPATGIRPISCSSLGAPSELLFGEDERVAQWVESRVGFGLGRPATAIGLQRQGKIIAGVMYTHYSERGSISAHIAGEGHWCSRRFLHTIFYYPFRQLKVRRITCYVESRHYKSRALCEHLGFTLESLMERATATDDVLIYRLFNEDCKWVKAAVPLSR